MWVLSLPWILFGIAFILIGFPSLRGIFTPHRQIISRVAVWCYAVASGAGFLFFGLNFGDEAGSATEVWVTRACIVQGLQQIWVSALWYWGYTLNGTDPDKYVTPRVIMYIVWPLSVISFLFAFLMFRGLPEYYHQVSDPAPSQWQLLTFDPDPAICSQLFQDLGPTKACTVVHGC